jgi:hypothetical protein
MHIMDTPIDCSLTEAQLAERRLTMLDLIHGAVVRIMLLPNGYPYRHPKISRTTDL